MASPFYLFRKYQRAFIAIAAVIAMFIFVLADPLMTWLQQANGGSQRNAETEVATWEGGSLNLQQLESLAQRRYRISEFLTNLVGIAAGMVEQEGGSPVPPTLPDFRLQDTDPRSVQVGCVTTRVLANLAEESGISVSHEVINHYLKEWGLRRMGDAEIANLLSRAGLSDRALFSGLRELLMGNFYISSYSLATRGVMPEERWQDWKRINERIAIDAAILPADKFVAEVPEPTEAELQQFYELHKDRVPDIPQLVLGARLSSPDPGFREPRRVRLQYLLGSVDDWTQKTLDQVTDAEIADYYERNKRAQFVRDASNSADSLFNELEKITEEETANGESASDDSQGDDSSSDDTDEDQPAEDDSSSTTPQSPFQLAAFQADEPESETASDEASSDAAPASVESEGDSTAEANDDSAVENSTDDSNNDSTEESTSEEAPAEYVPLEEVKEQIRRTLARDKAVVELQKIVDRTYTRLKTAYTPYGVSVVNARSNESDLPAPPAKLSDYKSLAKETGLASEETVLLSQLELSETFVGRAFDAQSRREGVFQAMFGDQELFEPYRALDLDGNSYIVSKLEDVPTRVPEFSEVKDAVLAAWKQQEAAKLALAKAEELAKQAKDNEQSVEEIAKEAGYEVVTSDMFSWLNFGTTPQEMQRGPRLGDAPPLEEIGPEFMTKAFELEADQKAAVLNYDGSAAYLIQLDRREQTEEELRNRFLSEINTWYGGRVMNSARWGSAQRQLLGELSERVGLNLDKLEEFLSQDEQ